MHSHRARVRLSILLMLMVAAVLSACGAGTSSSGRTGTSQPSPTLRPPTTSPTATPAVTTRSVSFVTGDHLKLTGTLFGSGHTAVVFSNQTDTSAGKWAPVARAFAARGYLALAYNYRGTYGSQGTFDTSVLDKDISAAIAFVRAQGASRLVLIGASIGGAATARAASGTSVVSTVILSAPRDWPVLPVTDDALRAITAPKLFVDSEGDEFADDVQAMYDGSPPPKEIHFYPGVAHGLDMFGMQYGDDLLRRIITFVQTNAPAS